VSLFTHFEQLLNINCLSANVIIRVWGKKASIMPKLAYTSQNTY